MFRSSDFIYNEGMYTPNSFNQPDISTIKKLISDFPLGLLITSEEGKAQVSPVPFLFREDEKSSQLVAHIARANSHWKTLENLNECLVIFQGHQNYISPSWYPSKKKNHKVVPTWNYEIVQVKGNPRIIKDSNWLETQIVELTNFMEKIRENPWKVSDSSRDYILDQIRYLVGIQIEITEIQGKWKMSQNKSLDDVRGVVAGLSSEEDPHSNPKIASIISGMIE